MEEYNKNAEKNTVGLKKEIEKRDKITKKTVLGILLLIVLIALIVVLANNFRKYSVIKDLQNTFSETSSSENYFMKFSSVDEDDSTIVEIYVKGEKKFFKREFYDNNFEIIMTEYVYQDGDTYNRYVESDEGKTAELNVEGNYPILGLLNYLESENNLETFIAALWADIEKTDYNEEECYIISNYLTSYVSGGGETTEIIVEAETGLCIETIIDDCTTEYTYEFENVDDDVFEEPDISEYTIIEEE